MNKELAQDCFELLCKKVLNTLSNKGDDYSGTQDRFSNFRLSEKVGVPAYLGAFIRLQDKFSRLCYILNTERPSVEDETTFDTLLDLIGYSLIVYMLLLEHKTFEKLNSSSYKPLKSLQEAINLEMKERGII